MGIVVIVVVAAFIAGLFYSVAKLIKSKNNSSVKRVRWMFGGYVVILLLSTGFASFVPEQKMNPGNKVDTDRLNNEGAEFETKALEGKVDQLDSKWKRKAWSINYQGQQLHIVASSDNYSDVMIIAERKATNDNQIEATFYQSTVAINNHEIAQRPQLEVVLADDGLVLRQRRAQLSYTQFVNTFPISQFNGETMFSHSGSFYESQSFLYLKIPKDLEVIPQENLHFEYVVK